MVTKEAGALTAREDGAREERVSRDTREEVRDDMEAKRVTKEEIKEDTRDGTPQEANKETQEEVKASSRTASGIALSAVAGGALPPTAQEELTR